VFPDHAHDGDLPFFADARAEAALDVDDCEHAGGFTLRHARIPAAVAQEFTERLMALSLEFANHERGGTREYAMLVGVFATNRPVAPAHDATEDPA
jgi:hypothetical protein